MAQSLDQASQQVRAALDNYISVCKFVRDSCVGGRSINSAAEFYHRLEREWDQSLDYNAKLAEAQAVINATRNTHPAKVTSLPPEILIQIFSLLLGDKPCIFMPRYQTSSYIPPSGGRHLLYLDTLSHVCSSWRRLTISLSSFWAHIDLVLNHPLNPGLFARAKACAIRAGETPLQIHICDPGYAMERRSDLLNELSSDEDYSGSELWVNERDPSTIHDFQFLPTLPADIGTLQVDFAPQKEDRACHTAALEYFLSNCKPGVFTCYSMKNGDKRFIESADSPQGQRSRLLLIPRRQLEDIWLGTTSLRINGAAPPWNSQAYRGLTELRLGEGALQIHESRLVKMLILSPKLRVFQLRTKVMDQTPLDRSIEPVHLEDLEELDVKVEPDTACGAFLRWIIPGPRDLQLSFHGWSDKKGTRSFCARSNITRLYLEVDDGGGYDDILFHCLRMPRLEVLGLNAVGSEGIGIGSIRPRARRNDQNASETCIDTLYLFDFYRLSLEVIQALVKRYSVRRLVVRQVYITYRTERRKPETTRSLEEVKSVLSTLQPLPVIQCLASRSLLDPEYWTEW